VLDTFDTGGKPQVGISLRTQVAGHIYQFLQQDAVDIYQSHCPRVPCILHTTAAHQGTHPAEVATVAGGHPESKSFGNVWTDYRKH
jgi:hypothetical protein